jgi:putative addiction module component (TIGR02574 family)
VVAQLVDRILVARHGGIDPEVDTAWQTKIERRVAEIEAGTAQGIPVEDSLARIRRIAGL